ncbi:hypothetical protein DUI87_31422 [Hirundo rustica rustica]|uniref:Uncharacterized protein n=1 Tax=Hirundo rustica rustica TaxID=333673 RepID=A0A3M0IWM6_HIRRU|nr:hypothetical protein DUI87_31422 [Hirundo rustica rustica]
MSTMCSSQQLPKAVASAQLAPALCLQILQALLFWAGRFECMYALHRHRFPDPLYYYPPQILHIDSVILLLMIPIGILQRPLGVC